jgi:hypothetical protein
MGNTANNSVYCCHTKPINIDEENEIKKINPIIENQLKETIDNQEPFLTQTNRETKNFQTTDNIIDYEINNNSISNSNSPPLKSTQNKKKLDKDLPNEENEKEKEKDEDLIKLKNSNNKEINQDLNDKIPISTHDPPYWNELNKNLEDEVFNINEKYSKKIFDFYNELRLNPEKFIDNAEQKELSDLLREYNKSNERPLCLIEKEIYFYTLCEILLSIYYTPEAPDDTKNKVLKDEQFKEKNKKLYYVQCEIENYEDAVWKLLKENENNAIKDLLCNKPDYCVIAAMPIVDSYEMFVYFLFLSDE